MIHSHILPLNSSTYTLILNLTSVLSLNTLFASVSQFDELYQECLNFFNACSHANVALIRTQLDKIHLQYVTIKQTPSLNSVRINSSLFNSNLIIKPLIDAIEHNQPDVLHTILQHPFIQADGLVLKTIYCHASIKAIHTYPESPPFNILADRIFCEHILDRFPRDDAKLLLDKVKSTSMDRSHLYDLLTAIYDNNFFKLEQLIQDPKWREYLELTFPAVMNIIRQQRLEGVMNAYTLDAAFEAQGMSLPTLVLHNILGRTNQSAEFMALEGPNHNRMILKAYALKTAKYPDKSHVPVEDRRCVLQV